MNASTFRYEIMRILVFFFLLTGSLLMATTPARADEKFRVLDPARFETVQISASAFLVRDSANSFSGLIVESDFLTTDDRKELEFNFKSLQQDLASSEAFSVQSIGPGLTPPKSDTVRYRTLLKEMGGTIALNEDYVFSGAGGRFSVFFISQLKDEQAALDSRDFIEARLRGVKTASAALRLLDRMSALALPRASAAGAETGHSQKSNTVDLGQPDPGCLHVGIKNRANIRRLSDRRTRMTTKEIVDTCGKGVGNVLEGTALAFAPGPDLTWPKNNGISNQTAEDLFTMLPGPIGLLNAADRTLHGVSVQKQRFLNWWAANKGDVARALQLALGMMPINPLAARSAAEMETLIAKQAKLAKDRFLCLRPDVGVKLVCETATIIAQVAVGSAGAASAIRVATMRARMSAAIGEVIDTGETEGLASMSATRVGEEIARGAKTAKAVIPQKPILVIASKSRRLKELIDHPVVGSRDLTDAVNLSKAPVHTFVKDKPTFAYRIVSDNPNDLPEVIRTRLAGMDDSGYAEKWIAENKDSVVVMQMDGEKADFYIASKATFDKDYAVVSRESVAAKNPKYALDFRSNFSLESDPNVIAVLKTTPTKMVKMSDVGFPIGKEARIQPPWEGDPQKKPAGRDAFLVYDQKEKKYYMVNVDKDGRPASYVPHKSRKNLAEQKRAKAEQGQPHHGPVKDNTLNPYHPPRWH